MFVKLTLKDDGAPVRINPDQIGSIVRGDDAVGSGATYLTLVSDDYVVKVQETPDEIEAAIEAATLEDLLRQARLAMKVARIVEANMKKWEEEVSDGEEEASDGVANIVPGSLYNIRRKP